MHLVSWLIFPQLNELTEYAAQREVFALIPAGDMLLTDVAIPTGSGRQLASVLPYLLEEELAQDVDSLHVHLLKRESDIAHVAVVEHRKIKTWLAALNNAGMEVKKLLPDCLCLPLFSDSYSAAELEGQWLIRQSETLGGVGAEVSWLDTWLLAQTMPTAATKEADDDNEPSAAAASAVEPETESLQPLLIRHYTPAPQGVSGKWQAETPELVMQLLALGLKAVRSIYFLGLISSNPRGGSTLSRGAKSR